MPATRELPQKIPRPPSKSLGAKAPGWGQIFGANPRGERAGVERWGGYGKSWYLPQSGLSLQL